MQPTCITCGRPVEEGETCCHYCLSPVTEAERDLLMGVCGVLGIIEANA